MQRNVLVLGVVAAVIAACSNDVTDVPTGLTQAKKAATGAASVSVVMTGLERPLGLEFGPEGGLYATEAGTATVNGPCAPVRRGSNCYSGTGAISRLWKGVQDRIVTGLPSVYNATTVDMVGPAHISFQGRGGMYVTIGWGGEPAARSQLGDLGEFMGVLIRVQPSGHWQRVADVAAFEQANNPDGAPIPDSNPYGVLAEPARQFVVDAGGNTLLEVSANGTVALVATFPEMPIPPGPFNPPFASAQAVPTQVRRGPDGGLYVSQLTGVPFLPGTASIFRVTAGQPPQVYAGGFTQVVDFAWAPDGTLYVLQIGSGPFLSGSAALVRVAGDGTRSTVTNDLIDPTALAIGRDGAIYVTNRALEAGGGEVLRIVP